MHKSDQKSHHHHPLRGMVTTAAFLATVGCGSPKSPTAATTPADRDTVTQVDGRAAAVTQAAALYQALQTTIDETLAAAQKEGKTPCLLAGEAHTQQGSLLASLMLQKIYKDRGIPFYTEASTNFLAPGDRLDQNNQKKQLVDVHLQVLMLYAAAQNHPLHGLSALNGKEVPPNKDRNGAPILDNDFITFVSKAQGKEVIDHASTHPGTPIALVQGALHMYQLPQLFANEEKSTDPSRALLKPIIQSLHIQPILIGDMTDPALVQAMAPAVRDYIANDTQLKRMPTASRVFETMTNAQIIALAGDVMGDPLLSDLSKKVADFIQPAPQKSR